MAVAVAVAVVVAIEGWPAGSVARTVAGGGGYRSSWVAGPGAPSKLRDFWIWPDVALPAWRLPLESRAVEPS